MASKGQCEKKQRRLVLIGGGGHCKSVLDSVLAMRAFDKIVITDPILSPETQILDCNVVGTDDVLPDLLKSGFTEALITVGSVGVSSLRRHLATMVKRLGFTFPIIIDPNATVSPTAQIGAGTFVGKNAVINADSIIGSHCIINSGAIIEHECSVGDFAHISVGAVLCGEVHVGQESFIGAGSNVIQCIKIGEQVTVGAGATVINNLSSKCTAVGIPARIIKNHV